MTDKFHVLGRGRLYFGDRLLGEVIPDPEDPVTLMRKRETTFNATVEIKDSQYPRWLSAILVARITRYNSQRLLTDQRTPEKNRADDMVAAYRKAFPDMASMWGHLTRDAFKAFVVQDEIDADHLRSFYGADIGEPYDPSRHFPSGGTVTGRWSGRRFPVMQPRDEFVVPKDHPIAAVDFGKVEARVMAHYVKPMTVDVSRFTEGLERATQATRRFAQQMEVMAKRVGEHVQRTYDRRIMIELFGHVDLDKPEPQFDRERRIAKLLKSRDPRQKKRGERLFLSYWRNRPGMNYNPYRKD